MQQPFTFESSDSLAQFTVWIVPVAGGGAVGAAILQFGGWPMALAGALACAALVLGLRASIKVTSSEVVIVKKWFFVPYRTHRGPALDDVWFGGDYGLEDGAIGVVVKLGCKEVHIGTRKNMRQLHETLWPLSSSAKTIAAREKEGLA